MKSGPPLLPRAKNLSTVDSSFGEVAVPENRWFWIRLAGHRKPRLKASFQRRSARGISEQCRMVVIGSAWATTPPTVTVGMVGAVSPVGVVIGPQDIWMMKWTVLQW